MTTSFTLFLTGLPGAGKTTIGKLLRIRLNDLGLDVELLDSDTIEYQFVKNIEATPEGRDLRVRLMAYAAMLLNRRQTIVILISTSPAKKTRDEIRTVLHNFIEVFVHCPVEVAIKRDPKGLYALARKGMIAGFPGIDSDYEPPASPEITINTDKESVQQSVDIIYQYLIRHGYLKT